MGAHYAKRAPALWLQCCKNEAPAGISPNWLAEKGIDEKANWLREEFLTGTAIAVIITLLIFLVNPASGGRAVGFLRRCPVCDHRLIGKGSYCSECGSKV